MITYSLVDNNLKTLEKTEQSGILAAKIIELLTKVKPIKGRNPLQEVAVWERTKAITPLKEGRGCFAQLLFVLREEILHMARPVYPYELGDPDFSWLLATFQEANPDFKLVDVSCLPLTMVKIKGATLSENSTDSELDHLAEQTSENDDEVFEKT